MPQPNDLRSGAIELVGASGTIGWSNTGNALPAEAPQYAYGQNENPNGYAGNSTNWYKWTPGAVTARIDTIGTTPTSLFPRLTVWTGTDPAVDFVLVAHGGSNSGGAFQAGVVFEAEAGVTYWIQLGVNSGTTTTGVLNYASAAPPANDDFADAILLTGASGSTTGDNSGATLEDGEPRLPLNNTSSSVWWKWVATSSGILEVDLAGSAVNLAAGVYRGASLDALVRVGASDSWYDTGAAITTQPPRVRCRVTAGETYYLLVAGNYTVNWGAISLAWSVGATVIANDHYEDAAVIVGASGSTSGTFAGASTEEGEPWLVPPGSIASDLERLGGTVDWGGYSVWFEWTCPADGAYQFDTIGSEEFTILGVLHDAPTILGLDVLTARANAYGEGSPNYRSVVTINATAGQVFKIMVAGDYGGYGDFVLNWATIVPPVNDNVANATLLTQRVGSVAVSNANATYEEGELRPPIDFEGSGRSVWYKLDIGFFAWFTFTFSSAGEDATVAVWTGPEDATDVSQLARLLDGEDPVNDAVYDWGTSGGWTDIPVLAPALYIQIDGYEGWEGSFTFGWNVTAAETELSYSGPNLVGSIFLGYFWVTVEDRNLDIELTYSATSGVNLRVEFADDPIGTYAQRGVPNTTTIGSTWAGSTEIDLVNVFSSIPGEIQGQLPSTGESGGAGRRIHVRVPLPELWFPFDEEPARREGVIRVWLSGSTARTSAYHLYTTEFDTPTNDEARNGIVITGSGEMTIEPEVWGGATREPGEVDIMTGPPTGTLQRQAVLSLGRAAWYRWTPASDSEVLYLLVHNDNYITDDESFILMTAFTSLDPWQYIRVAGEDTEEFFVTGVGNDQVGELPYPGFPDGEWDVASIPGSHDLAGYGAGDTLYIRVDLDTSSFLPLSPWRIAWVIRDEGIEKYGPDDLGILAANQFAGIDVDYWYPTGHANDLSFIEGLDPSQSATAGHIAAQFDIPHPYTETTMVDWGGSFNNWASQRLYERACMDVDGTVYAVGFGRTDGVYTEDVLVWDHGLLNLPTVDRFREAMVAADAAGVSGPNDYVQIVGDEVWIDGRDLNPGANNGNYVKIRCSKSGQLLGIKQAPTGLLLDGDNTGFGWYGMEPVWGQRRRRYFIVHAYATLPTSNPGIAIYDAETDTYVSTGLPTAAPWLSYDDGLVRSKSGNTNVFTSAVLGAPSRNPMSAPWEEHTLAVGKAAVVDVNIADVTIFTTWTTFPTLAGVKNGGIVFRFVDENNYLKATATGVYKVVNGVETLLVAYTGGFVFPDSSNMTVVTSNGTITVKSSGGTTRASFTDHTHRHVPASTWGVKFGVFAADPTKVTNFTTFTITSEISTSDLVTLDVTGPDWSYRRQDWEVVYEIIANDDRPSPWFDTFSQDGYGFAVGRDGKTLYVVRWWEGYTENARDGRYDAGLSTKSAMLTGNWIVTSVYAFDLETLTYIGKVGQYDVHPSFGPLGFFSGIYPYSVFGGNIYSGLREKAAFQSLSARVQPHPTRSIQAATQGPEVGARSKQIDMEDRRRTSSHMTSDARLRRGGGS